jgi:hypothetical protein
VCQGWANFFGKIVIVAIVIVIVGFDNHHQTITALVAPPTITINNLSRFLAC